MQSKSYKEFSQIYDDLMNDVDYEKWTSFITKHTEGTNILEAACGTGNITRLLADKNYKITAFDISQDMLMRANEKIGRNPRVKLLNMNMVNFKIDTKYDAALCCCDGINYIDESELERFFMNVHDHLNENGSFIFDMSTYHKYKTMLNSTYVYDDGGTFYVWENLHDESNKTVDMEINFFIKDSGDKYYRINEIQTQYIHENQNVALLLGKAGFKDIKIYDDYNDEYCGENSLRAVFVCKMRTNE